MSNPGRMGSPRSDLTGKNRCRTGVGAYAAMIGREKGIPSSSHPRYRHEKPQRARSSGGGLICGLRPSCGSFALPGCHFAEHPCSKSAASCPHCHSRLPKRRNKGAISSAELLELRKNRAFWRLPMEVGRSCQSNRNSSRIDGAIPSPLRALTMMFCHSACAAKWEDETRLLGTNVPFAKRRRLRDAAVSNAGSRLATESTGGLGTRRISPSRFRPKALSRGRAPLQRPAPRPRRAHCPRH